MRANTCKGIGQGPSDSDSRVGEGILTGRRSPAPSLALPRAEYPGPSRSPDRRCAGQFLHATQTRRPESGRLPGRWSCPLNQCAYRPFCLQTAGSMDCATRPLRTQSRTPTATSVTAVEARSAADTLVRRGSPLRRLCVYYGRATRSRIRGLPGHRNAPRCTEPDAVAFRCNAIQEPGGQSLLASGVSVSIHHNHEWSFLPPRPNLAVASSAKGQRGLR